MKTTGAIRVLCEATSSEHDKWSSDQRDVGQLTSAHSEGKLLRFLWSYQNLHNWCQLQQFLENFHKYYLFTEQIASDFDVWYKQNIILSDIM